MAPNQGLESPKVSLKSSVNSDSDTADIPPSKFRPKESVDTESLFSDKSTRTSTSGSSIQRQQPRRPDHSSQDQVLFQKRNILHEFERLSTKGFKVPKFTMASSFEEMRFEYDNIKKNIEVDGSVKFQRSCILGCISAIEFLNNRYDPFEIKLDGWTEQISGRIETFDDVMEEIYHKYKNKMKMAPELSLAFALISSMFFVHLANTAFKPSSQPSESKRTGPVNKSQKCPSEPRPTMRGPSNVTNADDTVSIMSDSTDVSHVSSLSSRITTTKKPGSTSRRTMHIE